MVEKLFELLIIHLFSLFEWKSLKSVHSEQHPLVRNRGYTSLLSSPQNRYLVGFQLTVVGDQGKAFRNCLCDQHSIERITVVWR